MSLIRTHRGLLYDFEFPSGLLSVLVSFGSLFWFYTPQLYCFGSLSCPSTSFTENSSQSSNKPSTACVLCQVQADI